MKPDYQILKLMLSAPEYTWSAAELSLATATKRRITYYHLANLQQAGLIAKIGRNFCINPDAVNPDRLKNINSKKRIINKFQNKN